MRAVNAPPLDARSHPFISGISTVRFCSGFAPIVEPPSLNLAVQVLGLDTFTTKCPHTLKGNHNTPCQEATLISSGPEGIRTLTGLFWRQSDSTCALTQWMLLAPIGGKREREPL